MNKNCLRENIFWIGYVDWDIRDFHGYVTERGSSYNAYLIKDEKIAIIDSIKAPYVDSLLQNITAHTDFESVDYLVCNHAEPDHSGSLPILVKKCINAVVVCNKKCQSILSMQYNTEGWNFEIVDESTKISLGKRTLTFINTPMAHWPESMFTYVPEETLLFSMDVFGQHYSSSERFDDTAVLREAMIEAKTYYANIIMLYGNQAAKVMKKAAGLDISMIAPSHGVIWRSHINEILEAYTKWMSHTPEAEVLIFYDTMWKSTALMADAIYRGANVEGVSVKKYDLKHTNITVIADATLSAAAMAVGSPTLNKGIMPKTAEALIYLKGLSPERKAAVAFGSYGWAKKGAQHDVQMILESMKCKMLYNEPIQAQFTPTTEVLDACYEAGRKLAAIALDAIK
jgi:flavorubredoxin